MRALFAVFTSLIKNEIVRALALFELLSLHRRQKERERGGGGERERERQTDRQTDRETRIRGEAHSHTTRIDTNKDAREENER